MKYSATEFTLKDTDDESMRKKISDLINITKTKSAVYPTLVTTYGLTQNAYASNIQSVVLLDDLFV